MTHQDTYQTVESDVIENVKFILYFVLTFFMLVLGGFMYHVYSIERCQRVAMEKHYSVEEIKLICGEKTL